jgi:hypothetical protein
MFRSSTIIRELALNLVKVIFISKHSVKLIRYLLCGCLAACCHTIYMLVTCTTFTFVLISNTKLISVETGKVYSRY